VERQQEKQKRQQQRQEKQQLQGFRAGQAITRGARPIVESAKSKLLNRQSGIHCP
jgi:hypothetical protein